jgi:hypothetical protein
VINHDDLVREEFARQADTFSASSAITDVGLTQRFVTAMAIRSFHRWNLIAARKPEAV